MKSFLNQENIERKSLLAMVMLSKNSGHLRVCVIAGCVNNCSDYITIAKERKCLIVINGVLFKHGIPMDSKFSGILKIKNRHLLRFVELNN
jgi:repressor of nif and glnA expression